MLARTRRQWPGSQGRLLATIEQAIGRTNRLWRFAGTGATCGMLQLGLLTFLLGRGIAATAANVVAFLLAAQLNFWLSQVITWRDRRGTDSHSQTIVLRWLAFHATVGGTAILNFVVFLLARPAFPTLAAAALGIAAASVGNYALGDVLTFRIGT